MLVSVTERTREIGLRLAVGALERDIVCQFLVEAVTLTAGGGLLGVFAGVLASDVLARLAGWPVLLDLSSLVLSVGVAGAIGIFFGYYPAHRAARLDPIAALGSE